MIKNQVIWTHEALRDLETIYDFLVQQSISAAQRIIEDLLDRSKQLESFPESGIKHEVTTASAKEYRCLVQGNYKIIYTFEKYRQVVYVATVFDTRLNPDKLVV